MSGYNATLNVGNVVPGEKYIQFTPKYPQNPVKNGVQFVHGAGSEANYCQLDLGSQGKLTSKIVNAGFTACSGDNGGVATWGNSSSTTKVGQNLDGLRTQPSVATTGKVALVSASMGGLIALNYALANPGKVSCIVSVIPVINPEDIRANNRSGYAAAINAAYGGSYVESTQGATRNPHTFRANSAIANIPMLFFYGATDTLCLPSWTEAFAAAAPSKRTLVSLPTGHDFDTYNAVNHDQIVDFLLANNVG